MKKVIIRATKESANKAMDKHIAKMTAKGWKVGQQFGGHAGLKYRVSCEFYK